MTTIVRFYFEALRAVFTVVCVSKVRDQGKKEEVPIQLVFTEKQ